MPVHARSEIICPGEVGVYHVWSRCVRRAFLCGLDSLTGNDFEYRRDWIRDMQEQLAGLFGIEIGFHAEMSNHLHLVLRTRPDVVERWSDEEVVTRWLQIAKLAKSRDGRLGDVSRIRINLELAIPQRVKTLRARLSDPSHFMATLCEYVGRRSNREDGCKGRFWEDRFGSRHLASESAVLICGIYIDLNQIRAGEAVTPETSTHTSAFDRIKARQATGARANELVDTELLTGELTSVTADANCVQADAAADGWMCELTIHEGLDVNPLDGTSSATSRRASDKGLLPISLDDYLQLLDTTGRMIRDKDVGKKSCIPAELAPILDRLGIQSGMWTEAVTNFDRWFGSIVGTSKIIQDRATQIGRGWLRGANRCAEIFG